MAERGRGHGAWWAQPKGEAHNEVAARLEFLARQNHEMRQDNLLYLNIMSNWNVDGSGAYGPIYWRTAQKKIRRNVTAAACDTAASLIAANRTIPSYLTSNGNFGVARKAEQRARVIHAQMWQLEAFELGVDAFYDGAGTGTGITHGFVNPTTLLPELVRVMPNSVFVDAAEGRKPRSLYWVHFVTREELRSMYPSKKYDLDSSNGPTSDDFEDYFIRDDNQADLVKVVESWHLASGPKAKDGRHVICTSNATLVDEPFTKDRYPFAFYHYAKRRAGFFGQGLVERTLPAQLRICELQRVVERCQDLTSMSKWLNPLGSGLQADDFTNAEGEVLTYSGEAPQLVAWQGTPMDLKQEIQEIAEWVFEQEGLSPGVVGGELPQKGLNSARAVRAADDVASRRQIIPTRALESYYLQIGRLLEDLNDECAALNPDYEVSGYIRAGRQQFLTTSKWKDLAIPEGEATLTVMSMSATPTTPQGRMAAVEEYIQGGFMSKPVALSLMEFPDVSAWQTLETSSLDLVEWQIERMLDGTPELPIPNQNLEMAKRMANQAFLVAYRMQAPEEVQQLFLDYIAYADDLIAQAKSAAMPPEQMAGTPEMSSQPLMGGPAPAVPVAA